MFGSKDVQGLVDCAGRALEEEDRYLTKIADRRHWLSGRVGIRVNDNERYYQFLIWRALMDSFSLRPKVEREGRHDFVFYEGEAKRLVAVAELKGWWSDSGEAELPGIRSDMESLGILEVPGVMLIVTHHAKESAEENLKWLAGELRVSLADLKTYAFDAASLSREDLRPHEFVVIGFLVAQKALALSA